MIALNANLNFYRTLLKDINHRVEIIECNCIQALLFDDVHNFKLKKCLLWCVPYKIIDWPIHHLNEKKNTYFYKIHFFAHLVGVKTFIELVIKHLTFFLTLFAVYSRAVCILIPPSLQKCCKHFSFSFYDHLIFHVMKTISI